MTEEPLSLRLMSASMQDCRKIWQWRNDPETRQASFNTAPISYAAHEKWYEQALQNGTIRLYIAVSGQSQPVGYVRLDQKGAEVSIHLSLDPQHRGKGYGKAVIRAACAEAFHLPGVNQVRALVKEENTASRKIFERSGFLLSGWSKNPQGEALEFLFHQDAFRSNPQRMRSFPRVLFRPDAGISAGMGHLQRCISLATALREQGIESLFLLDNDKAQERAEKFGFNTSDPGRLLSGDREDLDLTQKAAHREGCEAVVVDSYRIPAFYLEALRASGLLVVAVDDLAAYPFPNQMVINGGIQAKGLDYRSSSGNTRFLLGTDYALLRPEFRGTPARAIRRNVENILVTIGGSDPAGRLPEILKSLDKLSGDFTLTAAVGLFFKESGLLKTAVREFLHPVRLLESPLTLAQAMQEADIAVSTGGQTLYELAATGVPTVAFEAADNQRHPMAAFLETGFLRSAGAAGRDSIARTITKEVSHLLENTQERFSMGEAGRRLVDGNGAARTACALSELLAAELKIR